MIHLQGEQPYWYDSNHGPEGDKCAMCGEWSSNTAILEDWNEHICSECLKDEKVLKAFIDFQNNGDSTMSEIDEIIINLKKQIR